MIMKKYLPIFILSIGVYIFIVTSIQVFVNPKLTETERFLLLPKNLILKFEK